MNILTKQAKGVLRRARETYGIRKQLIISAEECNELAQALLKFFRYDDDTEALSKTREEVLKERADIAVILDHVDNIYGFTEEEIASVAELKIMRLNGWLYHSTKSEYTMQAREIPIKTKSCEGCFYYDHFDDPDRENACKHCEFLRTGDRE